MRKLQENLLIRLAAWVLFLLAVWGCAVFGQKTILGLSCVNDSIPQDTGRFSRVLDDYIGRVKVYVDSQNALTGALDFETEQIYRSEVKQKEEELNRSNTNFRYQFLTKDGSQVIYTNLDESAGTLEQQVQEVYTVTWEEYSGILLYGVIPMEKMEIHDEFYEVYADFAIDYTNFNYGADHCTGNCGGRAVFVCPVGFRPQTGAGGMRRYLAGADSAGVLSPSAGRGRNLWRLYACGTA